MSNPNQQGAPSNPRRLVSFAFENGEWKHTGFQLVTPPQQNQQPQKTASSPAVVPGGGWGSQELRVYNIQPNTSPASPSKTDPTLPPSSAKTYRILALYEGNFDDQGRRHGWGTLRVFRLVERLNQSTCISIACRWECDVPQIEWDPCRLVQELLKQPQQIQHVEVPSTQEQPADERPGCEVYADASRRLASVYNGLMLAMSQDFTSDRFQGLQWALSTQFMPHTLGEKHDLLAPLGGVKYCGQWQMGERHGFGMERQMSTGGLIYAGPYDCGARNGVGLKFHHQSKTCLDATWNRGRIVDCPGALHVQGFPISVLGRWSGDATVGQGRLCRANGASGVWETLFAEFDEQMPQLQVEVEQMMLARTPQSSQSSLNTSPNLTGIAAASGGSAISSLNGTANNVPPFPIDSNNNNDDPKGEYAIAAAMAHFVSDIRSRLSATREEVMCVCEPIACVLATPQMRSLLCVFQRCFLFSYGTCSPSGEDIGGGIMTAVDMAAATPPSLPSGEDEQLMGVRSNSDAGADTSAAAAASSSSASPQPLRATSTTSELPKPAVDESDDVFLAPKSCMSWCAMAVRDICQRNVFPQFAALSQQSHLLCIHRSRASRDTDLELFSRAVEDVVALVISVRLRLMNLANTALIGGGGNSMLSPAAASGAANILSSPTAAASANVVPKEMQHDHEQVLFAAALTDPAITPFYASGTPLSGSARAAVCAWDAVLDVSLAPLLKHAANVCRIENAKFMLATRRLVVRCASRHAPTAVFARDILSMLIPSHIVEAAAATSTTNDDADEKKQHLPSLASAVDTYAADLVAACKTLSNMLTDGQLSESYVTCASESTQAGLLFGCFRRSKDEQDSKRLRSNKASRLRRVGTEGALSGIVGAVTSSCIQVREASEKFCRAVNDHFGRQQQQQQTSTPSADASDSGVKTPPQQQKSKTATKPPLNNTIDPQQAVQWGLRFVVSFAGLNANSPRSLLPQLLLLDTVSEAEASEQPFTDTLDEMSCALLGIWRGDMSSRAAVPLATGAVFPVTLLAQWSIRSLRNAIGDITTLSNTPHPVSSWPAADGLSPTADASPTISTPNPWSATPLFPTSTSSSSSSSSPTVISAIFASDVRSRLEEVLQDMTRASDISSPRGVSSSRDNSPSKRFEENNTNDNNHQQENYEELLDSARIFRLWLVSYRNTVRRPLVPENKDAEGVEAFVPQTGPGSGTGTGVSFAGSLGTNSGGAASSSAGGEVLPGSGVGAGEVQRAIIHDLGLAQVIDRGMALLKSANKAVVSAAVNPAGAFLSPGISTFSARGDRGASFLSPSATTTAMAAITIANENHEAELSRRAARVASVMKMLSIRTEVTMKTECDETSSSDSDHDHQKKDSGSARNPPQESARGRSATMFAGRNATKEKKMVVRFFTQSHFEHRDPNSSSPTQLLGGGASSSFSSGPNEVENIDEDSLEEILEWWSGRRAMFRLQQERRR